MYGKVIYAGRYTFKYKEHEHLLQQKSNMQQKQDAFSAVALTDFLAFCTIRNRFAKFNSKNIH